jgi:hypothetical protein
MRKLSKMARRNGGFIGKSYTPTSGKSKPGIYDINYITYGIQAGTWVFVTDPTVVAGNILGTATTGSITIPPGVTSIKVYGCAGGGSGGISGSANLGAAGGGGGGACQINGWTLSVSAGQVYLYSVGSYGQDTSMTLNGATVFLLNKGLDGGTSAGGNGGAQGTYGSAAGGAGGAGGARFTAGSAGTSGVYCGGGGGGGGYGDNSPVTTGQPGGSGASSTIGSSITISQVAVTFTGQTGGAGGAVQTQGNNVPYALGGTTSNAGVWSGGGGGAGGGIKCSYINFRLGLDFAFGGGGGGSGPAMTTNGGTGGPGFLIVEYIA